METSGSFCWKITNTNLINKILNANNGDEFVSDIFKIAKLDWRIDIYPNGQKKTNIGSFDVAVTLMTMPDKWKSIIVQLTIHSPQTHSKVISLGTYTKDSTSNSNITI